MRSFLILLPLALASTPALAQIRPSTEPMTVPPELTDPAVVDRMTDMMQALSKALLSLPVGELQAAAEGRPVTERDKGLTVRDLGGRDDPEFERRVERQIAEAKPVLKSSMKAMADALPAMMKGLAEASDAIERAAANMPRHDYPRR